MHVERVGHEAAGVVTKRSEGGGEFAADHVDEEIDGRLQVGHGDADVVLAAKAGDAALCCALHVAVQAPESKGDGPLQAAFAPAKLLYA